MTGKAKAEKLNGNPLKGCLQEPQSNHHMGMAELGIVLTTIHDLSK